MKLTTIVLPLMLLLAACSGPLAGTSLDASSVFTVVAPAGSASIDDLPFSGPLYVSIGNTTTRNVTVTLYGLNTSSGAVSEILLINGTYPRNSTLNYSVLHKVVLNQSIVGADTTVKLNQVNASNVIVGQDTVVTISAGDTTAYNAGSLDGSSYAVPLITYNSSDIDTKLATEYIVYSSCAVIGSGSNMSVAYYISPDGTNWFAGAVAIAGCNNTKRATELTDKGVQYLRLQVTNGAALSNQELVKLVVR